MSYEAWGDPDDNPFEAAIEAGWIDPEDTSKAIIDVMNECDRQWNEKGYTDAHDDEVNKGGELVWAAACYAVAGGAPNPASCVIGMNNIPHALWPWALESFNPKDRRTDLVRAAALLVREIERMDRASEKAQQQGEKA